MFRDIDKAAVQDALEHERRQCPACDRPCRLDAPRCECGYDLRFEQLDPGVRFEIALRRRGWAHLAVGVAIVILGGLWASWPDNVGLDLLGLLIAAMGMLEVVNGIRILRGGASWTDIPRPPGERKSL